MRLPRPRGGLPTAILVAVFSLGAADSAEPPSPPAPSGHALLVGCTRYIHLSTELSLQGPENDTTLLRDLLTGETFHFDPSRISVLAGWPGDERRRPTRQNILGELQRLARIALPGEVVVVFLAGHGSQQPADAAPNDPEPDGLDEIFLPADVQATGGPSGRVKNAITDDEIRERIAAIRDRGAFVWLLVDACHSGTLIRGAPPQVERERRISMDSLVSPDTLAAARVPGKDNTFLEISSDARDIVALYATQPDETTPEMVLPDQAGAWHGLLTYTVAEVLSSASSPMTYRELVEHIAARYRGRARSTPNPFVEGGGLDRRVLGLDSWPERPQILLAGMDPARPGRLRLRAGSLHGLRPGSILKVYPPAGAAQAGEAVGHLRITTANPLEAWAEPAAYEGMPVPSLARLRPGSRCSIAFGGYGDWSVKVAVQTQEGARAGSGEEPPPVTHTPRSGPPGIEQALAGLAKEARLVQRVSDPGDADWFVRQRGGEILLIPASGWPRQTGVAGAPPAFSLPATGTEGPRLSESLQRIARAHNLLRVARESQQGLGIEMLRFGSGNGPGEAVPFDRTGRVLEAGDRIAFRLTNPFSHPVDVTLLLVDSGYAIAPLFPEAGEYNRLGPRQTITTAVFRVDEETTGPEEMIAIAVRSAGGQPASFTHLAQPRLDAARSSLAGSPLEQFLETALYGEGEGEVRGRRTGEAQDSWISLFAWRTVPAREKM